VFSKEIKTKKVNDEATINVIEFEDFMDQLFMKFEIQCPPTTS